MSYRLISQPLWCGRFTEIDKRYEIIKKKALMGLVCGPFVKMVVPWYRFISQPFLTSWAAWQLFYSPNITKCYVRVSLTKWLWCVPLFISQPALMSDNWRTTDFGRMDGLRYNVCRFKQQLGSRQSGCGMFYIRISQPALLTSLLRL